MKKYEELTREQELKRKYELFIYATKRYIKENPDSDLAKFLKKKKES